MKNISFVIILLWTAWVLINNPNVTPKQDIYLWLLGVISVIYTVISMIVLIKKRTRKRT
jgi:surface polysaccharide O-acyltransferase-like enzyme